MQINIEKLKDLIQDADKIFLGPEGEEVLLQLLEIEKQVELAIEAAKLKLEETALKLDPNFSSIQSDKIKVYYRSYGSRYAIDESNIDMLPKDLYETKTSYSVNTEAVDRYIEEHKGVPIGIIEKERPKSLSFSVKGKKDEE